MNINNLPTDNLYKFIALSGLAILFFSSFYLRPMLWNLEVEVSKLEVEVEYLKGINKNDDDYHNRSKDISVKIAEINTKINQHKSIKNDVLFSFVFGGFLTVIGFYFWYQKVQKPLDKKLNSDAKD